MSAGGAAFLGAASLENHLSDHSGAHKPRLLAVLPSLSPSAVIYTVKPLSVLADRGLVDFDYILEEKAAVSSIRRSDLVIYVRNNSARFNFLLEEARLLRIPTIYDIDDNFWEIPLAAPSGSYHRDPERLRQVEHYLRSVSLVRVYNRYIEERVRQFNCHIFRATPGIDLQLTSATAPARVDKVKITYVTQRGSKDELYELIIPDLQRLLQDFPDKIQLCLWRDVPEVLISYPSVQVVPVELDYEAFLRDLAGSGYDIGLAPLIKNAFYLSKTNTKFRDYGACRLAGIYADAEIYRDCVIDGETGLLVGDAPGDWYAAMVRLIQDVDLRTKIQENAFRYVAEHYSQEIMETEWQNILASLTGAVNVNALSFPQRVLEKVPQEVCVQWGGSDAPAQGFRLYDSTGGEGDLKPPFPFADGSVDVFLIVDRLDLVEDLATLLAEIYRVCRHGAQVCIIGRYTPGHVHQADPCIRQVMNEQTPRGWTSHPKAWLYQRIFSESDDQPWGLRPARKGDLDLRCIQMEFFYNSQYRALSAEAKRKARHRWLKVCDRIFYRLLVIKQPVSEGEMDKLIEQSTTSDPIQVVLRSYEERIAELQWLVDQHAGKAAVGNEDQSAAVLDSALQVSPVDLYYQHKARLLVSQVATLRSNRLFRLYKCFFDRTDAWNLLPAAFDPLKTDTVNFGGPLDGFRLALSADLREIQSLEYPVIFNHAGLCQIRLAAAFDLPLTAGELTIELVDLSGAVILTRRVLASTVTEQEPVAFQFPPVAQTGEGRLTLRVFARGLDDPLRLFELQRARLAGLGRRQVRCFAAFSFTSDQA